jgi:hypothetical protein
MHADTHDQTIIRVPAARRGIPRTAGEIAELRARLAGDIERLERSIEMSKQDLARMQSQLHTCDFLLRERAERVDPTRISTIRGKHKSYGGNRTALREALLEILRDAYPGYIGTDELAIHIQTRFNLIFYCPAEIFWWKKNSLRSALEYAAKRGDIDRKIPPGQYCRQQSWRARPRAETSLEALRERAREMGLPLRESSIPRSQPPRRSRRATGAVAR